MKITKGDTIHVISGKDKGKTGKVLEVLRDQNRIIVEGINVQIRHQRPKKEGQKGERVSVPLPIDASNALVQCSSCNTPTRVKITRPGNKQKVRLCKQCNAEL